ncbi:hypothetical protein C8J57DRAFT_1708735 [Mycena rebaudengoi]|nr:hypothetical protein C8J57DRAFT_1708735 [Mycena rebaudengoi]
MSAPPPQLPPPGLPPIPPDIAKLTVPLIIGVLLATFLFGILTVQFYFYHLSFPRDAKSVKCLVYIVYLLELAATSMYFADVIHWFAVGYGNLFFLDDIYLSAIDTPMIGSFLAAIAQCYYCYRLWTINRHTLPICIFVVLLALAQVASGIYGAVAAHQVLKFSKAGANLRPTVWLLNIGAAVADVSVALTMTVLLTRSRTRTAQTEFIIRRIINLTVETNLLSSIFAVLTVVLLVGAPGTNYFTAPSIILGKIYSNSLLLMLNNRKFIADRVNGAGESTGRMMNLSKFRAAPRTDLESTNQDISLQISTQGTAVASKSPEWV